MTADMTADTTVAPRTGWASLRDLSRYQWFVFAVAVVAWMADCMDQQFFNLARVMSLADLTGNADNPGAPIVKMWGTIATACFLVGWATGGLVFGMYGDRIGRVRTLTMTILLYSLFTGFSALSITPYDYCLYRFLTGLGVGGVFAAAVALLAETMPDNARPFTLGLMQALSAVGNITAALLYMALGLLETYGHLSGLNAVGLNAWRVLFLIGLVPALLVVFIQARLKEPESWRQAKQAADAGTGKKLGSYADLFSDPTTRRHALLGMLLAFVGVVGLWGIAFFSVDLQQMIFRPAFKQAAEETYPMPDASVATAEAKAAVEKDRKQLVKGRTIIWAGITSLAINVGAFFGMSGFAWLASHIGRKPAFVIALVASAATVALVFVGTTTLFDIIWMNVLMGVCMLALFGGYAIYLPELFPTRLRATGTSFCYNVGRFIAATGPLMLGVLTTVVFAYAAGDVVNAATGERQFPDRPFRYAGLAMCSIFILGLVVLPFLPETKDKPLPQE
jgi:MFS family permease